MSVAVANLTNSLLLKMSEPLKPLKFMIFTLSLREDSFSTNASTSHQKLKKLTQSSRILRVPLSP